MTPEEQAMARLRVYLAHMVDHNRDHIAEIKQQINLISDPGIVSSLTTALHDMVKANESLDASLAVVNQGAPGSPSPHHEPHHHHGSHHHVHADP